ncbi:MAG: Asp-tRNA(Asn)/Glu-tRNA(Gln) amidotransferase subunit GatA [Acidobacteria bacterium]|nr:Asp-tRNA(Asn)/Glu-tRNA(Gln) amidotransferase subunit GatA [Acidobacteriota bacterium]MBS1866784.1 Asp-tRNA(Asn)/Glu-tRNA(Gln) amidotransferase subunit GatA [Acidobacteriota bacterium]
MLEPWTISSVRSALAAKKLSARELAAEFFTRIDAQNPTLNAYLTLSPERAYAQADKIDALIASNKSLPPLAGVPIGVKDVLSTRGIRTTCSSKILENHFPVYDATAVERLESAGAVLLGKTNCDEFAMGSSNENSAFGAVKNPIAPDRVPGGSSGGSAAVVAAGLAVASLGTDTGGSIRQPGALCGIPAMMGSYGRVSRYGLIAFASSLDRIGPFANNVHDVAAILQTIAGRDPRDSTSTTAPVPDYTSEIAKPVKGLRIGIPKDYFAEGMHSGVRAKVEAGIALLKSLGCELVDIRMPHTDYAIATYYIIATAEASSNLARYDGVRYGLRVDDPTLIGMYRKTRGAGFGPEVKRRIVLGTYVLSAGYYDAYYLKGQKVRALIAQDFRDAFTKVDAIVTPTSPIPAFKLGEKTNDPLQMYLADIYTVTGSLAGVPGISVPCGKTPQKNLPVGLQIFGPAFGEARVLQLAHAFEQAGGANL